MAWRYRIFSELRTEPEYFLIWFFIVKVFCLVVILAEASRFLCVWSKPDLRSCWLAKPRKHGETLLKKNSLLTLWRTLETRNYLNLDNKCSLRDEGLSLRFCCLRSGGVLRRWSWLSLDHGRVPWKESWGLLALSLPVSLYHLHNSLSWAPFRIADPATHTRPQLLSVNSSNLRFLFQPRLHIHQWLLLACHGAKPQLLSTIPSCLQNCHKVQY